jgi:hypothetical protein
MDDATHYSPVANPLRPPDKVKITRPLAHISLPIDINAVAKLLDALSEEYPLATIRPSFPHEEGFTVEVTEYVDPSDPLYARWVPKLPDAEDGPTESYGPVDPLDPGPYTEDDVENEPVGRPRTLRAVTRLDVIDHRKINDHPTGIVFSAWDSQVSIMLQDDGRTLKVWVNDQPTYG